APPHPTRAKQRASYSPPAREGQQKPAVTAITKRSIVRAGGSGLFRGLSGAIWLLDLKPADGDAEAEGAIVQACQWPYLVTIGSACLAARARDHRCPKVLLPPSPCFRVPSCSRPQPSVWYWPGPWRSGPTTARQCSTR